MVNLIEIDVHYDFLDQNVDINELLIEYYYRILDLHKQDTREKKTRFIYENIKKILIKYLTSKISIIR